MIASLAVLLILAGVTILIIGLARLLFPSTNKLMPNDFKNIFTWRYGVYISLAGLVLLLIV